MGKRGWFALSRATLTLGAVVASLVAPSVQAQPPPSAMSAALIQCLAVAEQQQKNGLQKNVDSLEAALTRLRLVLPIDQFENEGVAVWSPECSLAEDLETSHQCGYGHYETTHAFTANFNRYSIGPYQMRPGIALRMETLAARDFHRRPRHPRQVIEDLLDNKKALPSVQTYLNYLQNEVLAAYPQAKILSAGVLATLYNEGQVRYRISQHKVRILTRVNRFGRRVEQCLQTVKQVD